LLLLSFCQSLFLTNNVTFIAINGLVGLALAPLGWMATLAGDGLCAGVRQLSAMPVSCLQARTGAQAFVPVRLAGGDGDGRPTRAGGHLHSFWLLLAVHAGGGLLQRQRLRLYRFAGPELVQPVLQGEAPSRYVLAGGIVGAFIGPNLASASRDLAVGALRRGLPGADWVAGTVVAADALSLIHFAPHTSRRRRVHSARAAVEGDRCGNRYSSWPSTAAALGYGVMNLLMAATPIAMQQCSHPFESAALVLEWHVLGMFVPSFFTGHLIKRFGVLAGHAAWACC
jgi:hypothetical protein